MSPSDWDDIIPKNWCLSLSLSLSPRLSLSLSSSSSLLSFSLCFDSLLLFS